MPSHREGQSFTAAECARRTGVTVKALRVYEREGLLKPMRTLKDWRTYDAGDLARIGEIIALRGLGLKLADIAKLLRGKTADMGRMLELQQEELLGRRAQIDGALLRIGRLRRRQALGQSLAISDLATAIKESHMSALNAEAIAWKRYEQMRPRTATAALAADMQAACGHFLIPGGQPMHVFLEEGRLRAQLHGQPPLELHAEARDRYFYTEVPAQVTFTRAGDGTISQLTLHQNGVEQLAPRISQDEADAVMAGLRARAAEGTPAANSRELLEALLDGQALGRPPYAHMTEALAGAIREQSAIMTDELKQLGKRQAIRLQAVTPDGWDCYRAEYESGELDVSIIVGRDGKLAGALLGPPKSERFWERLKANRL